MDDFDWLIYGAGGHGRVVLEILRTLGHPPRRIRFLDDRGKSAAVNGVKLLRSLPPKPEDHPGHVVVAIGDAVKRFECTNLVELGGWRLGTVIHPTATICRHTSIGVGSQICGRAWVGTGSRIGPGCILNTACVVDHDCEVGHHSHVAPQATLCGNVTVGPGCLIGAGAILLPGATVGPHAVVGAGAVIRAGQVVENGATYVGVPGRCIGAEDDRVAWGSPMRFA